MLLVRAKSGPSEIEGTGLFADQFIPAGTVVWRFLPGFDRYFPADYPESLSEPLRSWFKSAASFDDGMWHLSGDHAVLMNHSDNANVRLKAGSQLSAESDMVAVRDIRRGEEITADYTEFDAPSRKRGGAAKGEMTMSSMKKYIDQFRVNAGMKPDDRVLDEGKLAADETTREMEKKLADALARNRFWTSVMGSEDEEVFGGNYEEPPAYDTVESDEIFLRAFNPTVAIKQRNYWVKKDTGPNKRPYSKDQGYGVLLAFEQVNEKDAGSIDRKKSSLYVVGWNPSFLSEARYDDNAPSKADLAWDAWSSKKDDILERAIKELLHKDIPKLVEKTFPGMKVTLESSSADERGDLVDADYLYTYLTVGGK